MKILTILGARQQFIKDSMFDIKNKNKVKQFIFNSLFIKS